MFSTQQYQRPVVVKSPGISIPAAAHRLHRGNVKVRHIEAASFVEFLPHLSEVNTTNLDPHAIYKSHRLYRAPPELLIVVPTVRRPSGDGYLMATLTDLFTNLAEEERSHCQFVVLLAETDPGEESVREYIEHTVDLIRSNISIAFEEGLVEVIVPPTAWYPPDMEEIQPNFNDSQERMTWRVKQNLDYAYGMVYATRYHPAMEYYLQLEDDVITVPSESSFLSVACLAAISSGG